MSVLQRPLRLGLLREGKVPADSRVALTPAQAARVAADPRFELVVQPSAGRCFADEDFRAAGVSLRENLDDCEVLIGIKEVPVSQLLDGKTYFMFSHTHKCQEYNRKLLQAVVEKRIHLIDYELLTDESGARLIAFGGFAGMVGAHHGLRAWGIRTGRYSLPAMYELHDYAAAQAAFAKTDFGDVRVVVTGSGRVGQGAARVLEGAGLHRLTAADFLAGARPGEAVFTQLKSSDYLQPISGGAFDRPSFLRNPASYESTFFEVARVADILVHGIFWDNRAPALFSLEDAAKSDFRIQVISDVTCDIAPRTSIPATIRSSTIADAYFGFDPNTRREVDAFAKNAITMCTIDNLPNELPRDASEAFGEMFLARVLPELLLDESAILERATIAAEGQIRPRYTYLEDFLAQRA